MDGRFGKDKSRDIVGQRYGRLVVIRKVPKPEGTKARDANWLCLCDCGNRVEVRTRYFAGGVKSCGCLKAEQRKPPREPTVPRMVHHLSLTPAYRRWISMIYRCEDPRNHAYPDYGGRGIRVCERWRHDFLTYLADMGDRPSPKHSIDRIDNNGNYEPGNCQWATAHEQQANRRDRKHITFQGRTMLLTGWSRDTGIALKTLHDRLYKHGWTTEKALTTDPYIYHHRK